METNGRQSDDWEIPSINSFGLKATSKVWWSIYFAISILMIYAFFVLLTKINFSEFLVPAAFIIPMMIASGALTYVSITTMTLRIEITGSHIYYRDFLTTKEIPFEDVKGFRVISPHVSAIGLPGYEVEIESTKSVTITAPKTIENQDVLIAWLRTKFPDLNLPRR